MKNQPPNDVVYLKCLFVLKTHKELKIKTFDKFKSLQEKLHIADALNIS